jgi:hypothetical protein
MSDWEKDLLDRIVESLTPDPYWNRRLLGWHAGQPLGFSWHLAVFVEPFLSYVLDGSKTVESRFSVNRAEPYGRVGAQDAVLIKSSGGPIVAVAEVKQTSFYQLDREQMEMIREKFGPALRVEEASFWEDRKDCCYATIVGLANVYKIVPVPCDKRDKRGWVRLRYQPCFSFSPAVSIGE